ncbi:MAG: hypothetical protein R2754_10485 [Microthrixaceae bacterium]
MRRIKVLAVVALAALALGACGNKVEAKGDTGGDSSGGETSGGGGERSADEQAYVDELSAAVAETADSDAPFPQDQMDCWVGDMVDGIGVDKMKEAGFTAESLADESSEADLGALSDDERKVVADSFTKCVDLEEVFLASMEASGEEIPQSVKDCFAEIDWDNIEAVMGEAILANDEELSNGDEAMAPLMSCMLGSLGDLDTSAGTTTG